MNESNNRKVLISIKVSTLLLIIIAIVAVIVLATVVANNLSNNNNQEQISATHIEDDVTSESLEEPAEVPESRVIQASVSSRSLEISRTENTQEELYSIETPVEVQEEVIEEPEVITTPIEEVQIAVDMDLTVRTGLSREDFITLMAGVKQDTSNFFEENAGLIYDVCEKYQLNEIFFCGLISAESGWTIAQNHRNTYNYISLMSNNGLIKFSSVEDGMEKAAQSLHDNYLTPGGRFYYGPTLSGMKTKFCPASSTWVNLVYQRMQQILNNR